MNEKLSNLTFTIYPPFDEPQLWHLRGYLVGVWAVHQHHPAEVPPDGWRRNYWCISHAKTGVVAFVTKRKDIAIAAAKQLAELEPPTVKVSNGAVAPLPLAWIKQAVKAVYNLDVWASSGGALYAPDELLVDALRRRRAG